MSVAAELAEYQPRDEEALLELVVDPPRTSLGSWLRRAGYGGGAIIVAAYMVQLEQVHSALALLLIGAFYVAAYRVLDHAPARTALRFLREGVEIDSAHGWVRVPWTSITRVLKDHAGGASLATGTHAENGLLVVRLPKPQLDALLAAAVLPEHVKLVEAPQQQQANEGNSTKTFVLWVALILVFAAIWSLVKS